MWCPACGEQRPAIESTCMLMVCMMEEHQNIGTNGNQAVVHKKDFRVKKLSMYTLKGEFEQCKLSILKYKGKQKTKENTRVGRSRFPCV